MAASILIVDDEPRLGEALQRSLEMDGHTAVYLSDPEAALRALRARAFDVLLTDLVMPGIDGLEVLRRARTIRPTCEVVLMTAFATVDTARAALKHGAVDYLTKPFSVENDLRPLLGALLATPSCDAEPAWSEAGLAVEGMDPLLRRNAKMINYGIIYGIGAFGLAQRLGIDYEVARRYIEAYFERYPGIRDYMERAKDEARANGYVTTLFGRLCATPEIKSGNPSRRGYAERAAINAPIQGSAADIMKRAMIRAHRALASAGRGARMLLQVHDELVFEVPEEAIHDVAALVKGVMERAAHLDVPLVAEVGFGANWDAAH